MRQEVLRLERVSCQQQGILQLDGFNLSILSGEIMGLLPVNNHGLTALLRLLQHNIPLRYGYVYYREEQVNTWRNTKQRTNRIGLIQSESCLVEELTVADNIFVLRPKVRTWFISPAVLRKQLLPFLESIDIYISADSYVGDLTEFEKIVVDVLKSVVAGCKLIVLRDISANICEAELKKIHKLLRHYASQGLSFLYIDFHFEELRQICDKVALMSNGSIIKIIAGDTEMPDDFFYFIKVVKQQAKQQIRQMAAEEKKREPVFEVKGIKGDVIDDLSFSIAPGECIVLQNVDIKVFGELLSMINKKAATGGGEILIHNREITSQTRNEIAIIQELPTESMLFHELSYLDNLCFLLDQRLPEIWRNQKIREGVRREYEELLGSDVFDKRVDALSEIQKYDLIYTRIALRKPKVVFCVQPFRRADMELRMHIWSLLKMLIRKEISVAILAVNLADSLSLADRLIRIRKDKPDEIYLRSEFSEMPISAPWIDLYREP